MRVNTDDDVNCPVSLELLGRIYRADPARVHELIREMSEAEKAELALFCYGRAHLRHVGLTIASCCQARTLSRIAGRLGEVLHLQSVETGAHFGAETLPHRPSRRSISLARSAA